MSHLMVSRTNQQEEMLMPLPLKHSRCEVLQCSVGIRPDGCSNRGHVQMNATNRTVCIACPADTYSNTTASVCTLPRERQSASKRARGRVRKRVRASERKQERARDGAGKHVWGAWARNPATDRCWAGGPKRERYGMTRQVSGIMNDMVASSCL